MHQNHKSQTKQKNIYNSRDELLCSILYSFNKLKVLIAFLFLKYIVRRVLYCVNSDLIFQCPSLSDLFFFYRKCLSMWMQIALRLPFHVDFKPKAHLWIAYTACDTDVVISWQDILEGGNLRNALQELQQIIITPIKAYSPPSAAQIAPDSATAPDTAASPSEATKTGADKESAPEGFQSHNPPPCDGDSPATPISEGDIAGQFTRVMGKGESKMFLPDWSWFHKDGRLHRWCLFCTHRRCSLNFVHTYETQSTAYDNTVIKLIRHLYSCQYKKTETLNKWSTSTDTLQIEICLMDMNI